MPAVESEQKHSNFGETFYSEAYNNNNKRNIISFLHLAL